jgi:hypothetical protein
MHGLKHIRSIHCPLNNSAIDLLLVNLKDEIKELLKR